VQHVDVTVDQRDERPGAVLGEGDAVGSGVGLGDGSTCAGSFRPCWTPPQTQLISVSGQPLSSALAADVEWARISASSDDGSDSEGESFGAHSSDASVSTRPTTPTPRPMTLTPDPQFQDRIPSPAGRPIRQWTSHSGHYRCGGGRQRGTSGWSQSGKAS
jgi:hypothetical protein